MRIIELAPTSGGLIAGMLATLRESDPPRTGVHVGTVVSDMMRTINTAGYGREMETATKHPMWEAGNVVEDLFAAQLGKRLGWTKPEPRTVEGLTGSPDGYSSTIRTIDEIKATWSSQRDFTASLKFLGYMLQSMTYADMWQARRVRVHVWFLAYPSPPRSFVLRFTRAERREKFEQVRQHAVDRGWLKAA